MTTVVRNGTVELAFKADARVQNGVITEIGRGLKDGTLVEVMG